MSQFPMTISLDQDEVENLQKPVEGKGGMQDLLRDLQPKIVGSTVVVENEVEAERIIRCAYEYRGGGFQQRLEPAAAALRKLWKAQAEV